MKLYLSKLSTCTPNAVGYKVDTTERSQVKCMTDHDVYQSNIHHVDVVLLSSTVPF